MTRADRYTTVKSSPSKFLSSIASAMRSSRFEGSGRIFDEGRPTLPPPPRDRYEERELTLYRLCPARYRYEFIEGLHGVRDDAAYISFHRCVYVTVGWLEAQRVQGLPVDHAAGQQRLEEEWATRGPMGHPFEAYYRRTANEMVAAMVGAIQAEAGTYDSQEWAIPIGDKFVTVKPDRVVIEPSGAIRVQRIRTGRKTKSEPDNPIYALLRRGAAARYQGRSVRVESFYLATGETVPVAPRDDVKLIEQYAEAIEGIEQGVFTPKPDARRCPNCQCYFMCEA